MGQSEEQQAVLPGTSRAASPGLWQGLGDGLTQAVEMAVTPVLFALFGLFLDGRLHTRPGFTLAFLVLGLVGVFVRAYYHYGARIDALDEGKPWQRR